MLLFYLPSTSKATALKYKVLKASTSVNLQTEPFWRYGLPLSVFWADPTLRHGSKPFTPCGGPRIIPPVPATVLPWDLYDPFNAITAPYIPPAAGLGVPYMPPSLLGLPIVRRFL